MWGWAILSFLFGAAARGAYDRSAIGEALGLTYLARARIAFAASLIGFSALVFLAVANDGAWLPKYGWSIYSMIVAPRFVACIAGFLAGALINRTGVLAQISGSLVRVPAWVLSSAVGLLLIAGAIFALNPGLFDSLQSFKAGGIEATFASRSSNIREAEIHLNDVAQKLTLEDYADFKKHFIDDNSPRRKIADWFHASKSQDDRIKILGSVFGSFVNPIVLALTCLNEQEALEAAKRQESLVDLAISWQYFLLQLNKKPLTKDVSDTFFKRVEGLSNKFIAYARDVGKGCSNYDDVVAPQSQALEESRQEIWSAYDRSVRSLRGTDQRIHALTAMEPYVVGLAGDLIALMFGQKEKADFLEQIAEHFPKTTELLQPGIINIFFQIADAKVQSEVSWPIDNLTAQLDYALRGADAFISRSIKWKQEHPSDEKIANDIIRIYDAVAFRILAQNLAVYNQRVLRSEPVSEGHLRRWTAILSRFLAISHARLKMIGPVENVAETVLDADAVTRWPLVPIADRFLIDANIAIVLSLMLRHPGQEQGSASECAAARFYLKSAEENRRTIFALGEVNYSESNRLEQFIRLVGYRVNTHCMQRS